MTVRAGCGAPAIDVSAPSAAVQGELTLANERLDSYDGRLLREWQQTVAVYAPEIDERK